MRRRTSLVFTLIAAIALPAFGQAAAAAADRYAVSAKGPSTLAVGKADKVRVQVQPAAGWHMNLDFPASLSLTSSGGLSLAKAKLKKADAARLDDTGLVFEVPVTAVSAGAQSLDGTLKFAVCRDEACAPSKEKVAVRITVK